MPNEPQIEMLPMRNRQRLFLFLVLVFIVALPSLIFYTTGYRLSFENDKTAIVTTGGMYVTTGNAEVDVFLNEEQVKQPRLFRSAYYIQNISSGLHRIVVQHPSLQTWVKELPVDSHRVIEVAAFNMPAVTHLRPVTKYITATGTPVYLGVSSTTNLFPFATTTVPILKTESTQIKNYRLNEEYIFVESLFSTTTDLTSRSVLSPVLNKDGWFGFSTTTKKNAVSTTTIKITQRGNTKIIEKDRELYAVWIGNINSIPYYYCVASTTNLSIAERYGTHVAEQIKALSLSTTTTVFSLSNKICRPEIKLDRMNKDVYFYDFYPNNSDLILLQLEDGLYVTEIDDRSWQNSQLIYQGTNFETVIENNIIYIKDNDDYFEIVTDLEVL